jgi:hypothetical protein
MKIDKHQSTAISSLLKDKDKENGYLGYDSKNGFVRTAVENEIKTATLKKELTPAGRVIFEDLFRHKRYEAFYEAKMLTTKTTIKNLNGEKVEIKYPDYEKAKKDYKKSYAESSIMKEKDKK